MLSPSEPIETTFAQWVQRVATINERFSEALRDGADYAALVDPEAAIGLYRAADCASEMVQALRQSTPKPAPAAVNKLTLTSRFWFSIRSYGLILSSFI